MSTEIAARDANGGGPRPLRSINDALVTTEDVRSVTAGGDSQKLAVTSAASVASTTLAGGLYLVTADVPVYVRQGVAPVAVSTGADQYLAANVPTLVRVAAGNKLAAIAVATSGNVYITPLA